MGPNYRSGAAQKLAPLLALFLCAAGQGLPLCASLGLFLALTALGSLPALLAWGIPHTGSVWEAQRKAGASPDTQVQGVTFFQLGGTDTKQCRRPGGGGGAQAQSPTLGAFSCADNIWLKKKKKTEQEVVTATKCVEASDTNPVK